ncbi:hypothetical protein A2661_02635 [Candidatus Giovannonibacteria bacterium RIFCSPHIGHO2_01_FULL_45_24]|nr:MAG: hypothetical protein A2661_02635 [Candidatus Giovannonibacteria bacterium RIFCSPHIGHO2_01_FULL_45_24]
MLSFFKISKSKFIAKTNSFSYYLLVFVFAIIGAKLFSKARAARAFPPTPFLPAPPKRIRRVKRGDHLSSK